MLNQGMAFSLLSGKQLFLILATSAALLLVAYWLFFRSRGKYLQQAALILVLGGGIGNLIDRVLNGEVVDYINELFMRIAVSSYFEKFFPLILKVSAMHIKESGKVAREAGDKYQSIAPAV